MIYVIVIIVYKNIDFLVNYFCFYIYNSHSFDLLLFLHSFMFAWKT
jgi:hypothetical protein